MHAIQQPFDVDIQHLLPLVRVLIVNVAQQHHPGVVHHRIQWPKLLFGFANCGGNRFTVGDIDGAAQGVRQIQRRHSVHTTRQQQQRVAAFRQQLRGGKANTGAGAGYHD